MNAHELVPIVNISDWDTSVAWFEKLGFRPTMIEMTREADQNPEC